MHFDGHHVLYLWLYIIQYFYLIYFRRSALYNIHHDCILCHLHLYLFMFNFVSLGMPYWNAKELYSIAGIESTLSWNTTQSIGT